MNFMQLIGHIAGQGFLLGLVLIITLAACTAFDQRFPRDRLLSVFKEEGLPGSLLAAVVSVIFPPAAGGKIPLAARFRQSGGAWPALFAFALAGSALSFPALVLTFTLGWRLACLRLATSILFGLMAGAIVYRRTHHMLKSADSVDWLTLCEPDYCDIKPERAEWEETYPWRSYANLFFSNLRIVFPWLILSLLVASLFTLGQASNGFIGLFKHWWSPLLASCSGLPFFFLMGTDVPIAGALLSRGVSTATAISFMLGAPVVNFPVYLIFKRWLGKRAAVEILLTCAVIASALGWFVALAGWLGNII